MTHRNPTPALVAVLILAGLFHLETQWTPRAAAGDKEDPPGPIIDLPGHTGGVSCIAISPDGKFAATHGGLGDHTYHLWDLTKRRQAAKRPNEECEGISMVWVLGGKALLTGGSGGAGGGAVVLQDPGTGKPLGNVITHDSPVRSVAITSDGKRFAAADGLGIVRIYDAKTANKAREFEHGKGVNSIVFSQDGQFLLTGCDDKSVRLWNVEKDKQERLMEGHKATVGVVALSNDGKRAFSASFALIGDSDGTIRLWNTETGKEIDKLEVGNDENLLMSAAFSPDRKRALTGHHNGEVRLWDLETKKKIVTYTKHKHPICSLAFTPDGRFALSGEACQGGSAMWLYRLPP